MFFTFYDLFIYYAETWPWFWYTHAYITLDGAVTPIVAEPRYGNTARRKRTGSLNVKYQERVFNLQKTKSNSMIGLWKSWCIVRLKQ